MQEPIASAGPTSTLRRDLALETSADLLLKQGPSPDLTDDQRDALGAYCLSLAKELAGQGSYTYCLRVLEKARSFEVPEAQLYQKIGFVHFERGDFESSVECFSRALAAANAQEKSFIAYSRAFPYLRMGRMDLAERDLLLAIALDPSNQDAALKLAYTLHNQDKLAEAMEWLEKMRLAGWETAESESLRGQVLFELGSIDAAAAVLEEVPSEDRTEFGTLILVEALLSLRMLDRAKQVVSRFVAANPSLAAGWCAQAMLSISLGDRSAARDALEEAAKSDSHHPWIAAISAQLQ